MTDYTLPDGRVAPDLRTWRSIRIGLMKTTPQYQSLPSVVQKAVNYIALRRESPDLGAFEKQKTMADHLHVHVSTLNEYLRLAVETGVLLAEPRMRGKGTRGGRTSNAYRLNESLLIDWDESTGESTGESTDHSTGERTGESGTVPDD